MSAAKPARPAKPPAISRQPARPPATAGQPARPAIRIAVGLDRPGWGRALPDAAGLARKAARRAIRAALETAAKRPRALAACMAVQVSISLSNDAAIRELNRQYRGKDLPTNVLSFAALDGVALDSRAAAHHFPPGMPVHLGDVVLALETLKNEAREQRKSLKQHYVHLVVHGVLHLLGFDHLRAGEARRMEDLERAVLAGLGWPDPYLVQLGRK